MTSYKPQQTDPEASGSGCTDETLIEAVKRVLAPLARLCIANGMTFSAVEELLKGSFVQEAQRGAPNPRSVSRISTATGIRRREVTRLISSNQVPRPTNPPLASQVFARWTTDPAFRDHNGATYPIKRQGPEPSFDSLAQSITKDVHPRSLLEELIRLGLVSHDQNSDYVSLIRTHFVPKGDSGQMLHFLADNVGDHFDAAVANTLHDGRQHFEQAVFADELSEESVETLRPLITAQWQALCDALVPALTLAIEADAQAGRRQNQRVRIGLYSFSEGAGDNRRPANNTGDSANFPVKETS